MKKVKIVIVDDHLLFMEGLTFLLQKQDGFSVIGKASSEHELFYLLAKVQADIILLDINLSGANGLDILKKIKDTGPDVKIVMLSTYGEEYLLEKAMALGADGYLLKTCSTDVLCETILRVMKHEKCFEGVNAGNSPFITNSENAFVNKFQLTNREKEIIREIKNGQTSAQISERLCLSVLTVQTHRKNIFRKLGLANNAEMIKFIMENDF